VSDYQPRAQGGWPAQPPQGPGQGGYGQADYRRPGPGVPGRPQQYGPDQYRPDQYGPGQQAGRPPRRRRRHRGLTVLIVVLVVLVAIAVIGDQVAKSYAQNRVAEQIQTSAELNSKPSVNIEGWPFLTQIAAHNLRAVDITANNVTADSGKLAFSVTGRATGVHLNSSFNGATADHITGQATVPFSSVDGLLPGGLATMSADPAAGPNAVKVDAAIGSVTGTVKLASPSQIVIQLNAASGLASILGQLSGNSITIAIPKLPAGLVVKSVGVTSQGIAATASASHTTLTQ
jgi:LmeA-like phospholipid-binding